MSVWRRCRKLILGSHGGEVRVVNVYNGHVMKRAKCHDREVTNLHYEQRVRVSLQPPLPVLTCPAGSNSDLYILG